MEIFERRVCRWKTTRSSPAKWSWMDRPRAGRARRGRILRRARGARSPGARCLGPTKAGNREQGIEQRPRIRSGCEAAVFRDEELFGDVDGGVESCVVRGRAGEDFVVAGWEHELVFAEVKDREVDRIEFEGDGLRFAGSEGHAIPGDESL